MRGDSLLLGDQSSFSIFEQHFHLHAEKGLFWEEQKTLIISDLHLGKAAHFRKHGIPIPRQVHISDFQRINQLIEIFQPQKVVFLGDLFHSDKNHEWKDLVYWSGYHDNIEQVLVKGNHDILAMEQYQQTKIQVIDEWQVGSFLFTHEPVKTAHYNIYGHIHPSVRLRGWGRQGANLSCFYFSDQHAVMPAFGNFTGYVAIKPKSGDQIFAICEGHLIGLTA